MPVIIFLALTTLSSAVQALPQFGVGLGYELSLEKKVNAESYEFNGVTHGFFRARFKPLTAIFDFGYQTETSRTGSLEINTRSYIPSLWGRYEFLPERRWTPFAETGLGMFFDRVESKFGTAEDERTGRRWLWGAGGGITATFWSHFILDHSLRVLTVEDRKDVQLGISLRLGYEF